MAIELSKFIVEQLQSTTLSERDRTFLEKKLGETNSHIELTQYENPKQKGGRLSKGLHLVEPFEAIRKGPYIKSADVVELITGQQVPVGISDYGHKLIYEISVNGENSLAHLLIPTLSWNALRRARITTIPTLRDALESKELTSVRNLGTKGVKTTVNRLARFDRLLEESSREITR